MALSRFDPGTSFETSTSSVPSFAAHITACNCSTASQAASLGGLSDGATTGGDSVSLSSLAMSMLGNGQGEADGADSGDSGLGALGAMLGSFSGVTGDDGGDSASDADSGEGGDGGGDGVAE